MARIEVGTINGYEADVPHVKVGTSPWPGGGTIDTLEIVTLYDRIIFSYVTPEMLYAFATKITMAADAIGRKRLEAKESQAN